MPSQGHVQERKELQFEGRFGIIIKIEERRSNRRIEPYYENEKEKLNHSRDFDGVNVECLLQRHASRAIIGKRKQNCGSKRPAG